MCIICDNKYSEDSIKLEITDCDKISFIPSNLPYLDLYITNCNNLITIESDMYQNIIIKNCESLKSVIAEKVDYIEIINCNKLENLEIGESVDTVLIKKCKLLKEIRIPLDKLKIVEIVSCGCEIIEMFKVDKQSKENLESFHLSHLERLEEIKCESLKCGEVHISFCKKLNLDFKIFRECEELCLKRSGNGFLEVKDFSKLVRLVIENMINVIINNNEKLIVIQLYNIKNAIIGESNKMMNNIYARNVGIKKIEGFSELESLHCSFCNNLISVKDNPKLLNCFISNCRIITNVQNILNNNYDLNLHNCYWLSNNNYQFDSELYLNKIKKVISLQTKVRKYLYEKRLGLNRELKKYFFEDLRHNILNYVY